MWEQQLVLIISFPAESGNSNLAKCIEIRGYHM